MISRYSVTVNGASKFPQSTLTLVRRRWPADEPYHMGGGGGRGSARGGDINLLKLPTGGALSYIGISLYRGIHI